MMITCHFHNGKNDKFLKVISEEIIQLDITRLFISMLSNLFSLHLYYHNCNNISMDSC